MGFRIPHFQHFPPFASIIFLSFLIFQHPPCPPRWAHGLPLFSVSPGFSPWAPAWQELYVSQAVKCRGAGGGIPWRHLLDPPRGRGPSQTPPSLATDTRGCKGRSPLHGITLGSPFPSGRGSGGWGQKSKLKSGAAGNPKGKPPLPGVWFAPLFPCRAGFSPGDARGGAPCMK